MSGKKVKTLKNAHNLILKQGPKTLTKNIWKIIVWIIFLEKEKTKFDMFIEIKTYLRQFKRMDKFN